MSVWKKATKLNQKTHRERHQPESRKHLGLLEKHKDYVQRARDHNDKRTTLKLLHRKALNRNPDEFYHHMINSKVTKGQHHEKETEDEDTPEQMHLMMSQDLKYVVTKRTQEMKKIERLQSQLHLASVDHGAKNQHVYFEDREESTTGADSFDYLAGTNLPDIDVDSLKEAAQEKKRLYKELAKRIKREKELAIVQQKLEMKKHLTNKSNVLYPKKIKKGTKNSAPVYKWKFERKK